MDIRDKSVLILGAYGLVGQAVARRLLRDSPRRMILLSLRHQEAEDVAAALAPERGKDDTRASLGRRVRVRGHKDGRGAKSSPTHGSANG